MNLEFNPELFANKKILPNQMDTYVNFRTAIPKPSDEDAHLRHILRFYVARSMNKNDIPDIYVLPELTAGGKPIRLDVLGVKDGRYTAAICEPASVTPGTEDILEELKDVDDLEVIIVHSQYGNSGNIEEKFGEQIASKKFRVLAVVPPPFDDVYEYDIWMFETTFRDLFAED